VILFLNFICI